MYRRPRFLEVLHSIREEMAKQCHYDVGLFAEMVKHGVIPTERVRVVRGKRLPVRSKGEVDR
ncbi:MAG: hypothetical protein RMM17_12010 [Acidobacteriota bacterium]|nr:hypothetical protein [Blastocatellia bacterium]MDW8413398.1 hypothetical protein [Acidobacteriota bacterium]